MSYKAESVLMRASNAEVTGSFEIKRRFRGAVTTTFPVHLRRSRNFASMVPESLPCVRFGRYVVSEAAVP